MPHAWQDGHRDPLVPCARPWGYFPTANGPPAAQELELEWRAAHLGVWRSSWTEDASLLGWMRGPWILGHHRTFGPGHFTLYGGGGWLVGHPRHYGFGSGSEFWDRFISYNGMRFYSENDTASTEKLWFYTHPPVRPTDPPDSELPMPNGGGPNLTGQNPFGSRPAQNAAFPPDPWLDFQQRPAAFRHSIPLGHGPGWESIDWSPGFKALDPSQAGLLARPGINSRPTRVERWVRVMAWGDGWVVVLDDARPLPGVTTAWDLHLHGQPAFTGGAWHLERTGTLTSAEGAHQWPHVLPPATRAQGAELHLDGHLWIRQLAGGGSWTSAPTPTSGIRQWPHPGQTTMADGRGPDDWASWRLRLEGTQGVICHALQTAGVELPTGFEESDELWTVTVGGVQVTVDRASYEVTTSQ